MWASHDHAVWIAQADHWLRLSGPSEHGEHGYLDTMIVGVDAAVVPGSIAEVLPMHGGEGAMARGPDGAIYEAVPRRAAGASSQFRQVPLPAPAVDGAGVSLGRRCALLRGQGVWCWDRAGQDPHRLIGGSDDMRDLVLTPDPCAIDPDGWLVCWRAGSDRPRRVVDEVHAASGDPSGVCVIRGATRSLHCWPDGAMTEYLPRPTAERVASVGASQDIACWIADGTLTCAGWAWMHASWINVGPEGIDPITVPDLAAELTIDRPRRVMEVAPGTQVVLLGRTVCLAARGEPLACDPSADPVVLDGHVARLPVGRAPFRASDWPSLDARACAEVHRSPPLEAQHARARERRSGR
ncbi:MAG: hypothetical protein AB7S26_25565 [Sandaracinaceae bacterium]